MSIQSFKERIAKVLAWVWGKFGPIVLGIFVAVLLLMLRANEINRGSSSMPGYWDMHMEAGYGWVSVIGITMIVLMVIALVMAFSASAPVISLVYTVLLAVEVFVIRFKFSEYIPDRYLLPWSMVAGAAAVLILLSFTEARKR